MYSSHFLFPEQPNFARLCHQWCCPQLPQVFFGGFSQLTESLVHLLRKCFCPSMYLNSSSSPPPHGCHCFPPELLDSVDDPLLEDVSLSPLPFRFLLDVSLLRFRSLGALIGAGGGGGATPRVIGCQLPTPPTPRRLRPTVSCQRCCP